MPAISKNDVICDFGCGLGRLDIELSPLPNKINAIDISPEAINLLEEDIQRLGITNIFPFCKSTNDVNEKCDVGLMSFFGKSGQDMLFYRNLCKKKLVRVVNMKNASTLYPHKHRQTIKDTAETVKQELALHNIPFEFIETHIEFGQPLRSQEDAIKFIKFHGPNASLEDANAFLLEQSIKTEQKDYPIYIPNLKHIGIFIAD